MVKMDAEIFRDIKGYEGAYQVTNKGRVYSMDREYIGGYGARCKTGGEFLSPHVNKKRDNRIQVMLCKDGKTKQFYISVLVAQAFPEICGEWFEGAEVDHVDCNPMNNYAENLRVTDRKGNMANPITQKHHKDAMNSENIKTKRAELMKGENNPVFRCMTDEWSRKLDNARKKNIKVANEKAKKKVVLERNGVVKEFESLTKAAEFLGARPSDISAVCRGRYNMVRGWHAKYADLII